MKTTVDFYREEVKFTGHSEEYTKEDFLEMAHSHQEKRCDFSPIRFEEMEEAEAKIIDGQINVFVNEAGGYAEVSWCYIREE